MTQLAAKTYCEWLSAKTGIYYRLPTEAEWEYACRAGTTTAYSFGDDPAKLGEYAWYFGNSEEAYHKVGKKKPNPWGLYDMHGNVQEWCLDQYHPDFYARLAGKEPVKNPLAVPTEIYGRIVRGGSWDDDAAVLRSAARVPSIPAWKKRDPQFPQSVWYLTDADGVGFRLVRPLRVPSQLEIDKLNLEPKPDDLIRK
jgi:formylglycine-generating enzyme required for sulfatase activity